MGQKIPVVVLMSVLGTLGGCFEDDDNQNRLANGEVPSPAQNVAPTITGAPPSSVLEGQPYEFAPTASDADGDTLEFTISRKPAWASFDRTTGRLWGTPDTEDVGNFTNIGIAVSDGTDSTAFRNFDVTVNQIALGQATLSWVPPTENADGSTLTNLAGYRIYYGRNRDNLVEVVVLNNPGLTRYVVENLTPASWYFAMTSLNSQGVESNRSAVASKTIS